MVDGERAYGDGFGISIGWRLLLTISVVGISFMFGCRCGTLVVVWLLICN